MAKIFGWILMLLGLAVLVLELAFKEILAKITFLANIKQLWIIIAGIVLIGLGFLLLSQRRGQVKKEVPIYHDGKIIGYRRR